MPRDSAHSPINSSEDPSWLFPAAFNQVIRISGVECVHSLEIGSVNEIPTGVEEGIEQTEGGLFAHGTHTEALPFVSNAHTTQT